jgi:hypothetical protein
MTRIGNSCSPAFLHSLFETLGSSRFQGGRSGGAMNAIAETTSSPDGNADTKKEGQKIQGQKISAMRFDSPRNRPIVCPTRTWCHPSYSPPQLQWPALGYESDDSAVGSASPEGPKKSGVRTGNKQGRSRIIPRRRVRKVKRVEGAVGRRDRGWRIEDGAAEGALANLPEFAVAPKDAKSLFCMWRMFAQGVPHPAQSNHLRPIHSQRRNGRSAGRCYAGNDCCNVYRARVLRTVS